MDKNQNLEPDSKQKSVSFSEQALDRLALTQELISAAQVLPVSPPSIPRTKLSPGERYPVRPELSPNKLNVPHRDSAPDIDGAKVTQVRQFKHLSNEESDEKPH